MSKPATIVIKKIKKGGHGHHGGAWKVAYADFVTAMMAFFLLLWLLNSASEEQLHGIADFFSPTIGLKDAAGIGVRGGLGDSKTEGTKRVDRSSNSGIIYGAPQPGSVVAAPDDTPNVVDGESSEVISVVESSIKSALQENKELEEVKDNVIIDQTPEGLRIQITEKNGKPMFKHGTAELERYTQQILEKVVQIVRFLPNYLSVSGHTSSQSAEEQDGGWGLSGARANATRAYMIKAGLDKEQTIKLIAKADTEPLDTENPDAPVNRRISIVVLKDAKMAKSKYMDPNVSLESINQEKLKSYMRIQSKDDPSSPEYKAKKAAEDAKRKVQGNFETMKRNEVR